MGNGMTPGERRHQPNSAHRQRRLERARGVVESCVQDAAVVRALVRAERRLLLAHGDIGVLEHPLHGVRGAESDQAAPDDHDLQWLLYFVVRRISGDSGRSGCRDRCRSTIPRICATKSADSKRAPTFGRHSLLFRLSIESIWSAPSPVTTTKLPSAKVATIVPAG